MKSLILIMISGALINNVVLNQFLGICSFLGVSKQMKASASLGDAVIFVMTIASAVASLLYDFVLKPYGLDFMKTIVFILVIAALVQIVEMFLKKKSPAVYQSLGIYLPLITTNCAVLGIALTNVQNEYNFIESVLAGFGTAVGFTLAIILLAGIRSRIREEDLPRPVRGAPIVLISAALMSIAFMGFAALTTVLAVFENVVACIMDYFGLGRRGACAAAALLISVLSMPCVLGFNVWSSFEPFGKGTCVLDLEDFVVSDVLIPIGSLAFAVFCTRRYGWGWKNFLAEVNAGEGWPFPARLRLYCAYGIPLIILSLFVTGLLRRFG